MAAGWLSATARRHGLSASHLFTWRRSAREGRLVGDSNAPVFAQTVIACEAQNPLPPAPIDKGRPGPSLLANIAVSKYRDGLPLYRQSVILAREGIDVDRTTMADWMGHLAWWAMPLYRLIGDHVIAAAVLHTDDTPIRRLAPGLGRTVTARF